jgi:anti-sigma factor RsiW
VNVVKLDAEGHVEVESLLPWYVNGRLTPADRTLVDSHLAGCARCRAELEREQALQAAFLSLPVRTSAPAAGLAAIHRRLAAAARPAQVAPHAARQKSPQKSVFSLPPSPSRWAWVVAAQFAVIAGLLVYQVALRPDDARYHGLGPAGVNANAVVVFSPDATEAQLRAALNLSAGRIVGGPTASHAYLLVLPDAAALARLREQAGVTLVESLAGGASP